MVRGGVAPQHALQRVVGVQVLLEQKGRELLQRWRAVLLTLHRDRHRLRRLVRALWAVGNFCSVHATAGLGQAVGFPLTQVCVLVSATFGILFFGELADARARALFVAAAATVLAGAACLGAGQRPPR